MIRLRVRNPVAGVDVEPWMVALPVGLLAGGGLLYGAWRFWGAGRALPPGVVEPAQVATVPFATGTRSPAWPVVSRHPKVGVVSYRDVNEEIHGNWSRRFGAPRDNRNHVGIDLYAYAGDPVVAMADGEIVAVQSFHLGSWAIFVDHGDVTIMYGEIAPHSWREFGLQVGSRVNKGDPIARIACMNWEGNNCVSHMLHLEAYRSGVTKNQRWYRGQSPPPQLLDPTRLLLRAAPRRA